MKNVALRDFQRNASEYLKDLPIVLTRYSSTVGIIVPPDFKIEEKEKKDSKFAIAETLDLKKEELDLKGLEDSVAGVQSVKGVPVCKHGAMIGVCRFGCKK